MNGFSHAMFERGLKYHDLIGLRVRLRRGVKTRGGKYFGIDTVMYVIASYRGRLTLSKTYCGDMAIWKIGTHDLELVSPDHPHVWIRPDGCHVSVKTPVKECVS